MNLSEEEQQQVADIFIGVLDTMSDSNIPDVDKGLNNLEEAVASMKQKAAEEEREYLRGLLDGENFGMIKDYLTRKQGSNEQSHE